MARSFVFIILGLLHFAGKTQKGYIFYLHGRIVEVQGAKAKDTLNGYGEYRYQDILDSLKKPGFIVMSEVRGANTGVQNYARKVAAQVDSLLGKGVKPGSITVIGASKGSLIAMFASYYLKNPGLNFVLMGACNELLLKSEPGLELYGNILSLYETSDQVGGSCNGLKARSAHTARYKEIALGTGLRHGFLYRPIAAWLHPALRWASQRYD